MRETIKWYVKYCDTCQRSKAVWHAPLCSLAESIKVKTMKLYLTGIKSYQLDLGIECTAFTDPPLERTLQGIKRDHSKPALRTTTPLTRPHPRHMLLQSGNIWLWRSHDLGCLCPTFRKLSQDRRVYLQSYRPSDGSILSNLVSNKELYPVH